MRQFLLLMMIVAVAVAGFAEERGEHKEHHRDPFAEETQDILAEYRDRSPASLTFGEMEELSSALSVPMQKAAFVKHSAMASAIMPGMGQFKNDEPLLGALFMAADLAVAAGTAIGIHYLLPVELRAGEFDYLNSTSDEIHTAWQTAAGEATFASSWPIMAVATGGMVLKHVVSHLSARNARHLAMERIESGEVTFEPRVGLFGHGIGIGVGMRY